MIDNPMTSIPMSYYEDPPSLGECHCYEDCGQEIYPEDTIYDIDGVVVLREHLGRFAIEYVEKIATKHNAKDYFKAKNDDL